MREVESIEISSKKSLCVSIENSLLSLTCNLGKFVMSAVWKNEASPAGLELLTPSNHISLYHHYFLRLTLPATRQITSVAKHQVRGAYSELKVILPLIVPLLVNLLTDFQLA